MVLYKCLISSANHLCVMAIMWFSLLLVTYIQCALGMPSETEKVSKEYPPEICSLNKVVGDCKARLLRYYYNKDTKECETFFYGGCGGNDNNFQSVEECNEFCTGDSSSAVGVPKTAEEKDEATGDTCQLPVVTGPCKGFKKRYFFDKEAGYCRTFTYGGCQGNSNNFLNLDDCIGKCGFHPLPGRENDYCLYEDKTIPLGSDVTSQDDPCTFCVCLTPPLITCEKRACAIPILAPGCKIEPKKANECCDSYSCDEAGGAANGHETSPSYTSAQRDDTQSTICNSKCLDDHVCEPVVHCTGCAPVPECIPRSSSCQNVQCSKGEACEVHEVQCITIPCNPAPKCSPTL